MFSIMQNWTHWRKVSNLLQRLSQHVTLFIHLCDNREPRMRVIIAELEEISARVDKSRMKSMLGLMVGCLIFVAGFQMIQNPRIIQVLCIALGGIFILTGIIIVVCFLMKICVIESENAPKINSLTGEFRMTVNGLTNCLENIKTVCGNLRVVSVGDEALKFITLEIKILELFSISTKLRTNAPFRFNTWFIREYKRAADECVKMKSHLRTFYIQEGAENC